MNNFDFDFLVSIEELENEKIFDRIMDTVIKDKKIYLIYDKNIPKAILRPVYEGEKIND